MGNIFSKILYPSECSTCKKKMSIFHKKYDINTNPVCEECYDKYKQKKLEEEKSKKKKIISEYEKSGKFRVYSDSKNGFKIKIPHNWIEEEGQTTIAKFASPDGISKITVKLFDADCSQEELNKNQEDIANQKQADNPLIKREITLIKNEDDVYQNTYEGYFDNKKLKWTSVSIIKKGERYEVNFVSEPNIFEKYLNEIYVCINSFEFI